VGKRWVKAAAALAVVGIVGAGVFWSRSTSGSQARPTTETVMVAKGTVAPELAVTGVMAADERLVNAAGSGRVAEVFVKEGDKVVAGQKLVRLDGITAQQDVNIAWANLKSARARLQELKDKPATTSEIASQDAAVAKAGADYQKADESRDSLVLTSPIEGTVIDLGTSVGEQVGSAGSGGSSGGGTTGSSGGLITVADLTRLYISAAIDQADISKVTVGQPAKISLDALPGKEFKGAVTAIDQMAVTNQNVVTYTVHLSVEQLDPAARLGMTADITVDLGKKNDVLVVPNVVIRGNGDGKTVTKMIDGQATQVTVEVGASDADNTEITSGLSVGDKVVQQSFTSTSAGSASSGRSGSSFGGGRGMMLPGGGR